MKVLVAFASKHGSTKGIAEFIGEKLREKGIEVEVLPADKVRDLRSFDAFVIGSALYLGRWMKEAKQFASKNSAVLSTRPVWLFSSGPTGTNLKDAKGNDLLDPKVSGPKELDELKEKLRFRDHRIFFGAFDPKDLDFFSRQFFKSAAIREATPIGDFRDWKEIEAWSASIAQSLQEISRATTS
ncbi:MAG: flavodoxin domain-containing protein [Nitrososphaerota archaeon]|nr:flavodoxin domain-containing protein [Nitrososphaerota archaeon]